MIKSNRNILLTINGGSSSIKFALYESEESLKQLFYGEVENIGTKNAVLNFSDAINNKKNHKLKAIQMALKKIAAYHTNFNITNRSPDDSLIADIETVIKKTKPCMMKLFTEQQRNWGYKIFLSGKSAEYSFNAKVPLLVFNKTPDK